MQEIMKLVRSQAPDRVPSPPSSGGDAAAAINSLSLGLEEERRTRMEEVQEVMRRLEGLRPGPSQLPSVSEQSPVNFPLAGSGDSEAEMSRLSRGLEEERRTRMEEVQELARRIEASSSSTLEQVRSSSATVNTLSRELEQERQTRSTDFQLLSRHVEELSRVSSPSGDGRGGGSDEAVASLRREIEEERENWRSSIQELQFKMDPLIERVAKQSSEGCDAATVKAMLKSFAKELEDEREARSSVIQELHIRLGRELADMRQRDEGQSAALDQAVKCEREARVSETSELRSLVDASAKAPGSAPVLAPGTANEGEILTLYGMVKEALGDTVRLSMEIDEERRLRHKEIDDIKKVVSGSG